MVTTTLTALLKKYFGYSRFRPLQENIIRDSIAGRDVFALLPTGGGKSLCYQLTALAQPGLSVVVSPLIALMKDQVDSLISAGVEAAFLNSSLSWAEARDRMQGLKHGRFRLLYVAPERLMMPGFLQDLQNWNVTLLAIDEAHCISEWGHDFRPDYRHLSELRRVFPRTPIMALTATATARVREDVIHQLKLRNPSCYVASFNRPNLFYSVRQSWNKTTEISAFVSRHRHECGIVYCNTRRGTEQLAQALHRSGISARAYHAGMTSDERSLVQDLFLQDKIRVICATIAFGMGVNKPNVRFVIHRDLPKNLESYYQETGRAGRDGQPAYCLLLFDPGDVVRLQSRLLEKADPRERAIAQEQLNQMISFSNSTECRRRILLEYFGEQYGDSNCRGCDCCESAAKAALRIGKPSAAFLPQRVLEVVRKFQEGKSILQIADEKGMAPEAICDYLALAAEKGKVLDGQRLLPLEKQERIRQAFEAAGFKCLDRVKELAGEDVTLGELKIYRGLQLGRQLELM